jgi:hypothetical protein
MTNCKALGKFKDETHGIAPMEFVGLRSKMYSLTLPEDKQKATAKGIKRSFAKSIKHEQYRECLLAEKTTSAAFHTIRSRTHELRTEEVRKSALSPFDDKRYLIKGFTDTLAYGHFRIA